MRSFIIAALAAAVAVARGQPVGTIGHGTCGVFTNQQGFTLPAGPGVIKPNGNCKTDPKGFYPHTLVRGVRRCNQEERLHDGKVHQLGWLQLPQDQEAFRHPL